MFFNLFLDNYLFINTFNTMTTILIIIATYLVAKYGTFNTTKLQEDVKNIRKGSN